MTLQPCSPLTAHLLRLPYRLLLFGCHSGRHWPLVPRLQTITSDIDHPFREPTTDGLDAILPFCVSIEDKKHGKCKDGRDEKDGEDEYCEADKRERHIYIEHGVLEGLLGPLLLQGLLISNILGMLYLPVVLISLVAVVFTELDLECALGNLPIITILAVKVRVAMMLACMLGILACISYLLPVRGCCI